MIRARKILVATLVTLIPCMPASASSILAFATVGARSHQLGMLKIGEELVRRGHRFTLLLSSEEAAHTYLVPNMTSVTFHGPPRLGTLDWFTNMSRVHNVFEVSRWLGFRLDITLKCPMCIA